MAGGMTRRDIVELPPDLAEKIAAGEVVSRPLSVVKELLENSIDAGAGTITIEIRDGGKSLIRVTDDGAGIPAGQIETAFRRHATSKLRSPEDLDAISTLGFRGEALTSIAAVSRMELVSKARGEKIGSLIRIEGGRTVERKPVGTADGVTAIVRDLFFNTPARLKFLKSERAEGALIADMASRMALAYPSVRMRLINNGSVLFSTSGRGSLMANILTVYGGGVGEGLLPVEASSDGLSVSGYVSPPSKSRSSRRGQSFFVNGRPVSSRAMERAVSEGYRETLFEGRHPIAFLFLSVPPERVDVNVHPAKSEVRLDDEEAVSAFVAAAVRKAIRVKESVASVPEGATYAVRASAPAAQTGGGAAAGEGAAAATGEGALTAAGAVGAGDPAPAEQIDIKNLLSGMRSESEAARRGDRVMETPGEAYAAAGGGFAIGAIEPLTTLFATYIAGVDGDSLYLIDQHAAHERILYEQLLRQYLGREKATQQLIAPLVAEAPFQGTGEWGECLAMLASMGYEAEEFGPKALRVRAIPAFMSVSEAEGVLAGVLEEAPGTAGAGGGAGAERLISAACKRAVKANDRLADAEIRALLAGLERCENPYSCPHGRPIFIRLRRRDIERMFKRA